MNNVPSGDSDSVCITTESVVQGALTEEEKVHIEPEQIHLLMPKKMEPEYHQSQVAVVKEEVIKAPPDI